MSLLVGLTGGVGSGKSTVAQLFAALGVRIIDTDIIAHNLTQSGGAAIAQIRAEFGNHYIAADGSLERNKMRTTVFADQAARQRLESILHPRIRAEAQQQASTPTTSAYTLIVVPLLFESGDYGWLQRVIAVDCAEEVQLARTMLRSKLSETMVRAIMAQQLDRTERLALADEVIRNDGSLSELNAQVVGIHHRLSVLAAESD